MNMAEPFNLRFLRHCLIALLAAVSAAVVIDQACFFLRPPISHESSGRFPPEDLFSLPKIHLEPLQVFQEAIAKRNLFNAADADSRAIIPQHSLAEMVKDYRLKGVALFSVPEGIVEDAATGRTVFVKEGELLGPVTVKEIRGESVLLSRDGEEFELKMQGDEMP